MSVDSVNTSPFFTIYAFLKKILLLKKHEKQQFIDSKNEYQPDKLEIKTIFFDHLVLKLF